MAHSDAENIVTRPIMGYRWFRVTPSGMLAGAQGVTWPADEPLRAEHAPGGALQEVSRVMSALTKFGAGVPTCGTVLMAVSVGWIGVIVAISAAGSRWGALGLVGASALLGAVLVVVIAGPAWVYWESFPRFRSHSCPSRPPRLIGRWVPGCGIYAYTTEEIARAAAGRHDVVPGGDNVLARVVLWGNVFSHAEGWRAEFARIDALYDTDGRAVLPAAIYRVPLIDAAVLD